MRWSFRNKNRIHLYSSFETYNVVQVTNVDGNPKKEKRHKKKAKLKKQNGGGCKEMGVDGDGGVVSGN